MKGCRGYRGPLETPEDALGRTVCETRPGFRGSLIVTSNEYNSANQLVATRIYAIGENIIDKEREL